MAPFAQDRSPKGDDIPDNHSTVSDSEISNEEGWEDVEAEDDSQPVVDLFTERVYPDVRSMLKECKDKHGFDMRRIHKEFGV